MVRSLTPSQENYLEHILQLSERGRGRVRIREIAEAAGVKLPSVTKAVGKLAEDGFVRHQAYGTVEITEAGIKAAQAVVRRDDCLMGLLVDVLNMDEDTAKAEVCRLEHVLGVEVLTRLEVLVSEATNSKSRRWLTSLHERLEYSCPRRRVSKGTQVGTASLHVRGPHE